jgi:replication-associated recombination protein RarA
MKHALPFCGRKKELAQIQTAISRGQNVLISGSYGIGKTRLALEFARGISKHILRLDFKEPPGTLRKILLHHERIHKNLPSLRLVILDNIFRLSHQKADFIRFVVGRGYVLIAVEEKGIPEKDHFRLRCSSVPHVQIPLKYLTEKDTRSLLEALNERLEYRKHGEHLNFLAKLFKGHPLSLIQTLRGVE